MSLCDDGQSELVSRLPSLIMEPATERRRIEDGEAEREQFENFTSEPIFPYDEDHMFASETDDDGLFTKRAEAEGRFRATMDSIFARYGKDFEGVGDEVDMVTGEILVDNGHLQSVTPVEDPFGRRRKHPVQVPKEKGTPKLGRGNSFSHQDDHRSLLSDSDDSDRLAADDGNSSYSPPAQPLVHDTRQRAEDGGLQLKRRRSGRPSIQYRQPDKVFWNEVNLETQQLLSDTIDQQSPTNNASDQARIPNPPTTAKIGRAAILTMKEKPDTTCVPDSQEGSSTPTSSGVALEITGLTPARLQESHFKPRRASLLLSDEEAPTRLVCVKQKNSLNITTAKNRQPLPKRKTGGKGSEQASKHSTKHNGKKRDGELQQMERTPTIEDQASQPQKLSHELKWLVRNSLNGDSVTLSPEVSRSTRGQDYGSQINTPKGKGNQSETFNTPTTVQDSPPSDHPVNTTPINNEATAVDDALPTLPALPSTGTLPEQAPVSQLQEIPPTSSDLLPEPSPTRRSSTRDRLNTPSRAARRPYKIPSSRHSILSVSSPQTNPTNKSVILIDDDYAGADELLSVPTFLHTTSFSDTKKRIWKSSHNTTEVQRTPTKRRREELTSSDDIVQTPGGTLRICGVEDFCCKRDFCFTCI